MTRAWPVAAATDRRTQAESGRIDSHLVRNLVNLLTFSKVVLVKWCTDLSSLVKFPGASAGKVVLVKLCTDWSRLQ